MSAPSPPTDATSRLITLRARLDAVDTGIHRLLRERFEIVEEIGTAKGAGGRVIRPAREAAVMENRLAHHTGAMAPLTLAHIWRTIISAACTVQRPFSVHTVGALDVALFLYGPIDVTCHDDAAAAIAALAPHDVAVLHDTSRWWALSGGSHVIGRCLTEGGGGAMIVAGGDVERSAGAEAAVLKEGVPQRLPSDTISPSDTLLGAYDPFPLPLPAVRTSPS